MYYGRFLLEVGKRHRKVFPSLAKHILLVFWPALLYLNLCNQKDVFVEFPLYAFHFHATIDWPFRKLFKTNVATNLNFNV